MIFYDIKDDRFILVDDIMIDTGMIDFSYQFRGGRFCYASKNISVINFEKNYKFMGFL